MAEATMYLVDVVAHGQAADFGEIEEWLGEHDAELRLAALPAEESIFPPEAVAVDPITMERRGHFLMLTVGEDISPFGQRLAELRADLETNIDRLRTDTGIATILPEGRY